MAKYTKGKWSNDDKARPFCVVAENGLLIADCCLRTDVAKAIRPDDENKANAHLIATTPELLEACKFAVDIFKNDSHCGNKFFNGENAAIKKLELSIAKAEQ